MLDRLKAALRRVPMPVRLIVGGALLVMLVIAVASNA